MRTLVVGAGAVGGYYGGRLAEAGRDVTFLVRPRRASELADSGLRIRSRYGDVSIPSPQTVLAENLNNTFDVVLLSCKAYDLDNAMAAFAPAVGPLTAILPLLNGMLHLDALSDGFGRARVLGGQCFIAATLDQNREIIHLSEQHGLTFGELDGPLSARVHSIEALMEGAVFAAQASGEILLDMWEKWFFLASLAGGTCLMRSSVGDIMTAPGGADLFVRLLEECRSIAAAAGYSPRAAAVERARGVLTTSGSPLTASMLRDLESGSRIEGDHIIGDLLHRAHAHHINAELLSVVNIHLKAYEARRARQDK